MQFDLDETIMILSGVRIFQDLDLDVIEDMARHIQIASFSSDELVAKSGAMGERLFVIFKGKVEVRVPDLRGNIKKRIQLKKGEVVGEISLLIDTTYSADVAALSDTVTFYLDKEHFELMIERHQAFADVMTKLMTSRMAQLGGINKVGKYQLRGKLGEGNMATVFNAWDEELQREVAIKMLKYKLAFDEVFVQRFEDEARIIAGLNHPNIVNVYEVIDDLSTRFIVMEKLHGRDLSEVMDERGALDPGESRDILAQVASALQYAHNHGESGIVHRDIKPSNIMIDKYGNIKLTDFGIASPPKDKDINIEGSPSYLAPEVINGESFDGRADIYALGVMAFHMLTNTLPFSASTLAKLLLMQVEQTPPNIRIACPEIDEPFAEFVEASLQKNPDERISDWARIRTIFKLAPTENKLTLAPGELAIVVRFHDSSYQQSAKLINTIKDILQDEKVNHSIEMQRGEDVPGD